MLLYTLTPANAYYNVTIHYDITLLMPRFGKLPIAVSLKFIHYILHD